MEYKSEKKTGKKKVGSEQIRKSSHKKINDNETQSDLLIKEKDFHNSLFNLHKSDDPFIGYFNKSKTINVQDAFINSCRHSGTLVKVKLIDSSEETGSIIAFDNSSILLQKSDTGSQSLLMKFYIVKISPDKPTYSSNKNFRSIFNDDGQVIYDFTKNQNQ